MKKDPGVNDTHRKIRLSIGVFVHNEAKTVERCLKSFTDIVDEVIVVHDGPCSDDSLKIAKRYTRKVFTRPWSGTCEAHFNFVKTTARNEWMMFVDADEYFSEGLREHIGGLIRSKDVDCYDIYWPTFHRDGKLDRQLTLGLDRRFYKRVLFRKNKTRFEGYLHEKRKVDGIVKKTDYALIHRPDADIFSKEYLDKKAKWASVAAKMLAQRPLPHNKYYYLFKAPLWFAFYLVYSIIFRMYFISGIVGIRYSWMYARYNFNLNINLYRIKDGMKDGGSA
jgi:glycosyltransferase involved in cell wall biosynthesis